MADAPRTEVTPEQVRLLAQAAGIVVDEEWLPSLARRVQELREGAAVLDELPLKLVEPAAVFRAGPQG